MGLHSIEVKTKNRIEFVDITSKIEELLSEENISQGICVLFCPHTTAGILLNENADPTVREDIESLLSDLVKGRNFKHLEGNSDAHIKSSLIGNSVSLIIENGTLLLGTWQGIFFCEFDGPRTRKVFVKIIEG